MVDGSEESRQKKCATGTTEEHRSQYAKAPVEQGVAKQEGPSQPRSPTSRQEGRAVEHLKKGAVEVDGETTPTRLGRRPAEEAGGRKNRRRVQRSQNRSDRGSGAIGAVVQVVILSLSLSYQRLNKTHHCSRPHSLLGVNFAHKAIRKKMI